MNATEWLDENYPPALSMRSVALAAAILLIARPEAILEPGFQMSFAFEQSLLGQFSARDVFRKDERAFRYRLDA